MSTCFHIKSHSCIKGTEAHKIEGAFWHSEKYISEYFQKSIEPKANIPAQHTFSDNAAIN